MEEIIIKAGTTQLTPAEAKSIHEQGKFVVNYGGIYQPHYSQAQKQFYFSKISNVKGIAKRGRFYAFDGAYINKLLGYTLINEI
jgi:hypothetical protein